MRETRPDDEHSDQLPIELYKLAVEEYRFQAEFNWKRTQYLLAFNAAILAAGLAVAGRFGGYAVPVFALGIVACALAALILRQQHTYYRAARDHMSRVAALYAIPEPIDTTATLGHRSRRYKVTDMIYLLLAVIGLADAISILVTTL